MIKISSAIFYLLFFSLSGCAANVETFNSTSGLGKQLQDLNQAFTANAITDKEYKKAKEILIEHYK